MVKVQFEYNISEDVTVIVKASCVDVDSYEVNELNLKFYDIETKERVAPLYDRESFEEIEAMAFECLYEEKYTKELYFGWRGSYEN